MKVNSMLSTVIAAIAAIAASSASARPAYFAALSASFPEADLENTTRCMTCHQSGRQLNPFGKNAIRLVIGKGQTDYRILADLDSDGDGQTNIEELIVGNNPGVPEASPLPAEAAAR